MSDDKTIQITTAIDQDDKPTNKTLIVRDVHGRFLPGVGNGGSSTGISSPEQARALAHRRYELQRAAHAAGVVRAIVERGEMPPGQTGDAGAWSAIATRATQILLDADSAAGFERLASFVGKSAGWTQDKDRDDTGGGGITMHIDIDTARAVLAALRDRRDDAA